jgi:hypothetical protein
MQESVASKNSIRKLTSDEIAAAMARCTELSEVKAEEVISNVEMSLDLTSWETSEWIVEITEQAHKWF